jgi:hypothetical protein
MRSVSDVHTTNVLGAKFAYLWTDGPTSPGHLKYQFPLAKPLLRPSAKLTGKYSTSILPMIIYGYSLELKIIRAIITN